MGGRLSRNKGKRYERRIATLLRELGYKVRRGWQTRSGRDEPDLIVENFPWWVECTHRKNGGIIFRKYAQGVEASDGRPVLLFVTEDRGVDLVVMDLDSFLGIGGKHESGN